MPEEPLKNLPYVYRFSKGLGGHGGAILLALAAVSAAAVVLRYIIGL